MALLGFALMLVAIFFPSFGGRISNKTRSKIRAGLFFGGMLIIAVDVHYLKQTQPPAAAPLRQAVFQSISLSKS